MKQPDLSIIIPAYNEASAIRTVLIDIINIMQKAEIEYEVIVVDDGSSDNTADEARNLGNSIKLVHHPANRGYGASLKTGIRHARSKWICITDADGTYPNDRIPELYAGRDQFDMVVGSRTGEDVTYSPLRAIPKIFLRRYANYLSQSDIPDINSGLRLFRREKAMNILAIFPDGFSFTTTITLAYLCNGLLVNYVPINYHPRVGKSKIRPVADTLNFFLLLTRTGMYFAPIRVLTPFITILALCFLLSVSYDLFVLHNLTDKTVAFMLATLNAGFFALLADLILKNRHL